MGIIVDTVEDRTQSSILTARDTITNPGIELVTRSKNASYERYTTSVMASPKRGEHIGITVPPENVSEGKNTLHVSKINDETRNKIQDKVSELSVLGASFDREPQTHHRIIRDLPPARSQFSTSLFRDVP